MKRYCRNFIFTLDFIEKSMLECLDHKTGKTVRWFRKDTSYFFAEFVIKGKFIDSTDINFVAKRVRDTIASHMSWYRTVLIPYIAVCLQQEILERKIKLKPILYQERLDSSSRKLREIGITSIKQQVYDYIVVNACKEMFLSKIGTYQCSSVKGRGQVYAKEAIENWVRRKYKWTRYVSKFDVKKYYPSVPHDVLFNFLERDIKNKDILYVLKTLVGTYSNTGYGLCIGTYLSQFLANYLLSYAYHYASEQLFKIRKSKRNNTEKRVRLIYSVIFYMDDIALFGSRKRDLKTATHMMIKYLHDVLGLELKHNQYQLIDMHKKGAFLDMVGYRFYTNGVTVRKRIFKKLSKNMKTIRKYKERVSKDVCASFMSRHGYIKNSDSKTFRRKNKYEQLFEIARRKISNEAKGILYSKTESRKFLSDHGIEV